MRTSTPALPVFTRFDRTEIEELRRRNQFLWVDLSAPSDHELDELGDLFGLHPLALEDVRRFGRRPKLDDYGDHLLLVFYGASLDSRDEPRPIEVHVLLSGESVVTVHREPCPELVELRRRFQDQDSASEQWIVYRILAALTDSFFPVLETIDDELDGLEEAIIAAPTDGQLARIFRLKRALAALRRVVDPARDLFQRAPEQITGLPGLAPGSRDYFRDVYDHLLRISELIDSYRDVLTSAMDVYLSTNSNRLNLVMQRLTVIATIFLPLTFVTGFFGQNFRWLVDHMTSFGAFAALGIGALVLSVTAPLIIFKRAGYLASHGRPPPVGR
jgi:magnesium transporter